MKQYQATMSSKPIGWVTFPEKFGIINEYCFWTLILLQQIDHLICRCSSGNKKKLQKEEMVSPGHIVTPKGPRETISGLAREWFWVPPQDLEKVAGDIDAWATLLPNCPKPRSKWERRRMDIYKQEIVWLISEYLECYF